MSRSRTAAVVSAGSGLSGQDSSPSTDEFFTLRTTITAEAGPHELGAEKPRRDPGQRPSGG